MNYEHIALRSDQLETLCKYSGEIERRFDVEFYVKHGNSLVHLCGSLEGAGEYQNSPTHSVVFIRCRNAESQRNVPLAKVRPHLIVLHEFPALKTQYFHTFVTALLLFTPMNQ